MITVQINGEDRTTKSTTVSQLIAELGLAPDGVAVAINRSVVPRSAHAEHPLSAGDKIEIIRAVGGG